MEKSLIDQYMDRIESAIFRTMRRIHTDLSQYPETNLTPAQFMVLRILNFRERVMVTELADFLQVKPSAVTTIVDRLVRSGWVTRTRTEEDRRVVYVEITAEGRDILQHAESCRKAVMQKYFSLLDATDMEQLVTIYEKLAARIEQQEDAKTGEELV